MPCLSESDADVADSALVKQKTQWVVQFDTVAASLPRQMAA
jgi:hypothetical protein